jgi:hypothetical protein
MDTRHVLTQPLLGIHPRSIYGAVCIGFFEPNFVRSTQTKHNHLETNDDVLEISSVISLAAFIRKPVCAPNTPTK